nr:DUF2218 domain-containing protein [uncultured Sphingomonas sp.]
MIETVAYVPTSNAAKYVAQLCKHWSHKLSVEQRDDRGVVRFGDAVATLESDTDELVITILANDEATAERLRGVVATHLDRFAFREAPHPFEWRVRG